MTQKLEALHLEALCEEVRTFLCSLRLLMLSCDLTVSVMFEPEMVQILVQIHLTELQHRGV